MFTYPIAYSMRGGNYVSTGHMAVFGANSAAGTALLKQIAAQDALRAVAVVRRPAAQTRLPQSPRIAPRCIDFGSPESLRAVLGGVDSVVHLAGVLFESRQASYRSANVDTTRAVVEAARAAGVGRIVLVSSLGADPRSPNGYFRSKGEAEALVAGAGIDAAIIRTPLLLGSGTAGGQALLRAASRRSVRILGGGAHLLRPLDVDDLCGAILRCCQSSAPAAGTYELVGPTTLSYRDLLLRTACLAGREVAIRSTPVWLAKLGAGLSGLVRGGGLTPAVIDVITSDEAVGRNADEDLGVSLTPLSTTLAKLVEADGRT